MDSPWWQSYYDQTHIKFRDRCLFAELPLPADLAAVKHVDWTSLDTTSKPKPKSAPRKPARRR